MPCSRGTISSPPITLGFARSLDGGETWQPEALEGFSGDSGVPLDPPGGIDFSADGFALRVMGAGYHGCEDPRGRFYYTLDRGHHWRGPYHFGALPDAPELRGWELTPRTDYVVYGPRECLLLLSARPRDRFGSDRVFCAKTTDGGATFRFLSWVVSPEDPYRAVMPSTVRLDPLPLYGKRPRLPSPDGDAGPRPLVTAIRRREPGTERCWIDAYVSRDDGASWSFLSFVGDTGAANGNPPALLALADGRLCCVYGDRTRRRLLARAEQPPAPPEGRRRSCSGRQHVGAGDIRCAGDTDPWKTTRISAIPAWCSAPMAISSSSTIGPTLSTPSSTSPRRSGGPRGACANERGASASAVRNGAAPFRSSPNQPVPNRISPRPPAVRPAEPLRHALRPGIGTRPYHPFGGCACRHSPLYWTGHRECWWKVLMAQIGR